MVYDGSHKLCEECGISFHSPWERNCLECNVSLRILADEIEDEEDRAEILSQYSESWRDWITMRDAAIVRTKTDGLFGRYESTDTRT